MGSKQSAPVEHNESHALDLPSPAVKQDPCVLTKLALDECIEKYGSKDACLALIDTHRKCLRSYEIAEVAERQAPPIVFRPPP